MISPIGRVPLSLSRQNKRFKFHLAVGLYENRAVPALRMMDGVMKLKSVTMPCPVLAPVPASREGRLEGVLACSAERIAAGKLHTPGAVSVNKVRAVSLDRKSTRLNSSH